MPGRSIRCRNCKTQYLVGDQGNSWSGRASPDVGISRTHCREWGPDGREWGTLGRGSGFARRRKSGVGGRWHRGGPVPNPLRRRDVPPPENVPKAHSQRTGLANLARRPARRRRRSERRPAGASGGEQSALALVVRRKVRFAATVSGIREPILGGAAADLRRLAQPAPDS